MRPMSAPLFQRAAKRVGGIEAVKGAPGENVGVRVVVVVVMVSSGIVVAVRVAEG